MKLVAVIFSIFIFVLTVIPCTDQVTCEETPTTEVSHNHDHSDDQQDDCTPFCTCQCCGISVTLFSSKLFQKAVLKPITAYNFYYVFHYSDIYLESLWHPPVMA